MMSHHQWRFIFHRYTQKEKSFALGLSTAIIKYEERAYFQFPGMVDIRKIYVFEMQRYRQL